MGVKKPTAVVAGGCGSLAEGGAGTSSSASTAFGSVEQKHQPFLVLPSWVAVLARVGQIAVPCSFKWATANTTVGNHCHSPMDSGRNHTPGMVEELKG